MHLFELPNTFHILLRTLQKIICFGLSRLIILTTSKIALVYQLLSFIRWEVFFSSHSTNFLPITHYGLLKENYALFIVICHTSLLVNQLSLMVMTQWIVSPTCTSSSSQSCIMILSRVFNKVCCIGLSIDIPSRSLHCVSIFAFLVRFSFGSPPISPPRLCVFFKFTLQ